MTTALLDRSRLFAEAGTPVDVLTLDDRARPLGPDSGVPIGAGVRIRNLYDWARSGSMSPGTALPEAPAALDTADDGVIVDEADGVVLRLLRLGGNGKPRDIDHLRPDGTIALSERRVGTRGRMLLARDAAGRPVRAWRLRYDLYSAWLDHLIDTDEAFVIVDSKTVAPFAAGYHRRRATTVHVVHGSHRGPTPGSVRASRQAVFSRLADFDATVFATEAQAADVREIVGGRPFLTNIAHPVRTIPPAALPREGKRTGAVVLARLEPIKRVEDAIAALLLTRGRSGTDIPLDVYGRGSRADDLAALAAGDPGIRFHGHTDDPAAALSSASVLLLTSRSEAFGLVLLEAMAAGCLPIAYDIAYGPAELIRDGVNGWLVPEGDVDALADAVRAAAELDPDRRAAMRARARATAAEYDGARIRRRWAGVLRRARRRRRLRGGMRRVLSTARGVAGALKRRLSPKRR
ncbi:glycosyltransferase [Microbacterium oleivorans]|uniref:Glycosyltransferase n=1 Tax=Microbacterium oleivorans TaxID=273677 RepID=A0A7D5EXJ2_9MICO|nr:glycosyltransferase [Microbacterium oleivorans]QLD12426.1 glycosyltransferase [Microbacterium oleivorans]